MFFWSELRDREVGLTDEAQMYVVGVLVNFSRSDRAYAGVEHGERPALFDFLERALGADPVQRRQIYRHIGDLAMFTAGLFPRSLRVSRSYYVQVGSGSYGSAAGLERPTTAVVLEELADRFEDVTDALTEAFSA